VVERVLLIPPAEAWEWARANGWPLPSDPSAFAEEPAVAGGPALVLTSPDPGTVYALSSEVPHPYQAIRVAARPAEGVRVAEVTLYVDGEPLATLAAPPFEAVWPLEPGEHRFWAEGVDEEGRPLRTATAFIHVRP